MRRWICGLTCLLTLGVGPAWPWSEKDKKSVPELGRMSMGELAQEAARLCPVGVTRLKGADRGQEAGQQASAMYAVAKKKADSAQRVWATVDVAALHSSAERQAALEINVAFQSAAKEALRLNGLARVALQEQLGRQGSALQIGQYLDKVVAVGRARNGGEEPWFVQPLDQAAATHDSTFCPLLTSSGEGGRARDHIEPPSAQILEIPPSPALNPQKEE